MAAAGLLYLWLPCLIARLQYQHVYLISLKKRCLPCCDTELLQAKRKDTFFGAFLIVILLYVCYRC